MQDHGVTKAFLVPPILVALAKHPLVDQYDLSALERIVSGAAPAGRGPCRGGPPSGSAARSSRATA